MSKAIFCKSQPWIRDHSYTLRHAEYFYPSVGLPKKVQHYLFFQIDDDVTAFRKRLSLLIPLITTTTQAQEDRAKIAANKKKAAEEGRPPELLKVSGVNIAFSQFGLHKVRIFMADIGDMQTNTSSSWE